jgi:hypothetical protein
VETASVLRLGSGAWNVSLLPYFVLSSIESAPVQGEAKYTPLLADKSIK